MSPTPSILLLCVPPIAICFAVGGTLAFIGNFRRSFGTHTALPPLASLVALLVLFLHAGFFLAPLLLHLQRPVLALSLVVPVSIVATLGLVWLLLRSAEASETPRRLSLFAYGLMAAYALPIIVLAIHAR